MQLSVIIVNYNVKHFLEQCLFSVQKASQGIQTEVIVVDNHSLDKSVDYLQPKFPTVQFISNTENLGFAKACNQGFAKTRGKYVVFLNPDTLLSEDCFQKCMAFLNDKPDGGAMGIKMLDGSAKFLKESKRSFPSPVTSLYKLFGLSRLFPRSPVFSKYHLGHLDENKNHEVDVLAGAFMLVKREVLEKVGGFDEIFFMYGEDVDLSYRIQKAGYKNYYYAGSQLIHFKGESTRKGSMNYVRMFYNAMSLFVRKHYGGGRAGFFNFLIYVGIWMRAGLTAIAQFIRKIGLPLLDAGLIFLAFWIMKNIWNNYVRTDVRYENRLLWIAFPAYTVFYLITAYYAGLYDRWYKPTGLIRSMVIATIVLLAAYALLPEQYRFSRGIVLFGAVLAFVFISVFRWILIQSKVLNTSEKKVALPNTIIVGSAGEYNDVVQLLEKAGLKERILGRVAVNAPDTTAIGDWTKMQTLSQLIPFREVIYCEGQLTFAQIIDSATSLPGPIRIRFHAKGSASIVGSDSKDKSGESLSVENGFKLSDPYNRRLKRLADALFAFFSLCTFPIHLLLVKKPFAFIGNCFAVLFAQKTWIGYAIPEKNLPPLRPAIIACNGLPLTEKQALPEDSLHMVDYWYVRDYELSYDVKLLWRMYRRLGG